MKKKITDEQLNKYLELRIELGEDNFDYLNRVYSEIIFEKKNELTKDVTFEMTDFPKFRNYAKNSPHMM